LAPWSWNKDAETRFPTAHEVAAELELDPSGWIMERADSPTRRAHHVTQVERYIFLGADVPDLAATFHVPDDTTVHDVFTAYREATHEANEVIVFCSDLNDPTRHLTTRGKAPSMRWALAHMIEETGHHAGHADILRALIDGQTGR
jgi:hypothetical protein